MAFIFIMPMLAAISARYRAAEMVLPLHPLTIFSFLLALELEHASTRPITVGHVAGSTLIVRRTTLEKISGPFTIRGGALLHMFQLPSTALPRVRVLSRRPPSRTPLGRGLPSQMFARVLVHVGVILPPYGQLHQQIDQIIIGVRASFPLGRLRAELPSLRINPPYEPYVRLCRPLGRGVHAFHELFQLRNRF